MSPKESVLYIFVLTKRLDFSLKKCTISKLVTMCKCAILLKANKRLLAKSAIYA